MVEISSYNEINAENEDKGSNIKIKKILQKVTKIKNPFKRNNKSKNNKNDDLGTVFIVDKEKTKRIPKKYSKNLYNSKKYTIFSFFPLVIFNQFRVFYNFYFLLLSCAYFVPILRVGVWWTSWAPLIFFLFVSCVKEAIGDFQRLSRDKKINNIKYQKIERNGFKDVFSKDIKPGDFITVNTNQRVPADMILISTNKKNNGMIFVKTDQLDGETDWKMRRSVVSLSDEEWHKLFQNEFTIKTSNPSKLINEFKGVLEKDGEKELIGLGNTLWAGMEVASGVAVGLVVHTGKDTKHVLNQENIPYKMSLFESEANYFTKLLFVVQLLMSFGLAFAHGFTNAAILEFFRFLLLLSFILPFSLRVNLDSAKTYYSLSIANDKEMSETIVRNPDVCEELGRLSYFFTDKTGTLTQNKMVFKKLKVESGTLTDQSIKKICSEKKTFFSDSNEKLRSILHSISICHNVSTISEGSDIKFQGASTDEISLSKFVQKVGYSLLFRDENSMIVSTPFSEGESEYKILYLNPFTAQNRRMGVLVRREHDGKIIYFTKGAEDVMQKMTLPCTWVSEEVENLAEEGLRTLVFAKKTLSPEQARTFLDEYIEATEKSIGSEKNREDLLHRAVQKHLECDLTVIGATGVEDKLRSNARNTLEMIKQTGMKIWVLTGDKAETAICVAKATGLIKRTTKVHRIDSINGNLDEYYENNTFDEKCVLVLTGTDLETFGMENSTFIEIATKADSVIICRSSPTQKSKIVRMVQKSTGKRVCAVGDGGNDVGMIRLADAGIGIEGKEGKSAALAADLSTTEFESISKLFLWHGRNAYLRSANLVNLLFTRGVFISILQTIFSISIGFKTESLFDSWQLVGYSTIFTSLPILLIILDKDIDENNAMLFPQFYERLQNENHFSFSVFFCWLAKSAFQGSTIMLVTLLLFNSKMYYTAASFAALIVSELFNIIIEVKVWNFWIFFSLILSFLSYLLGFIIFTNISSYSNFDLTSFLWKTSLVITASCLPVLIYTIISRKKNPLLSTKIYVK